MSPKDYSHLAALIFAVIAALQLTRAVGGWPVTAGTVSIPLWASWIACAITAILAWLGFNAARR